MKIQKPTLGRVVTYRSRTGNYDVPAIIAATQDTLYRPNVEAGHITDLSGPGHVHLVVFSSGGPGKRVSAQDFVEISDHPIQENIAGTYQEWDIAYGGPERDDQPWVQKPGTWRYPQHTTEKVEV